MNKTKTHTGFIDVLCADISYRATGVSIIRIDTSLTVKHTEIIECPPFGFGFKGLEEASFNFNKTICRLQELININYGYDYVVAEMPAWCQSAKAAMCIGICWGGIRMIPETNIIDPSILKIWSGSKKGDGKSEVKEKVSKFIDLSGKNNNDNIIDALGIGFALYETMLKESHK